MRLVEGWGDYLTACLFPYWDVPVMDSLPVSLMVAPYICWQLFLVYCLRHKEDPKYRNLAVKVVSFRHQASGSVLRVCWFALGLVSFYCWVRYNRVATVENRWTSCGVGDESLHTVEKDSLFVVQLTWLFYLCTNFLDEMASVKTNQLGLCYFFLRCRRYASGEAMLLLALESFVEGIKIAPAATITGRKAWASLQILCLFSKSWHIHLCWLYEKSSTYPEFEYAVWMFTKAPIYAALQLLVGFVVDVKWLVLVLDIVFNTVLTYLLIWVTTFEELLRYIGISRQSRVSGFNTVTEADARPSLALRIRDNVELVPVENKWITLEEYELEGEVETEKELRLLSAYYAENQRRWPDREDWKAGFLELRRKWSQLPSLDALNISLDQAVTRNVLCVVCLSAQRELMCRPCNHLCLCRECAKAMGERSYTECPMCRKEVTNLEVVYL